jgi:hypothetical protein
MRDKYTTFKGAHSVTQNHSNNTLHRWSVPNLTETLKPVLNKKLKDF